MRMLLRGVIEEREILVDSIEDVMWREMEGEDEYDPISVRAEDSPVSRLHLIKTVSSNKELTESLALQFPNLMKEENITNLITRWNQRELHRCHL